MRRLRSAVQRDPRRALSLASEHASRFGDASSFSAERELYRVQALAHLGERTRAESRARRFRQRFPGSPYAAAIEAALRSNALTPAEPGSP
ncbi:MAG: hypothetical protein GXP55_07770 [Deltaproteobacteria bacterium]|nr:hypothetical protein [Deltaproteobacteria bacterium]